MQLNYTCRETSKINELLNRLEVARRVIDVLPLRPAIEENLRQKSLLKSAVFSARIEGNKLRLADVQYDLEKTAPKDIARMEIYNIHKAMHWIHAGKTNKTVTKRLIKKLHKLAMRNISSSAGRFRTEQSAIFNQAGVAIYMPPPPTEIPPLIDRFLKQANSKKLVLPINTAICHFGFEKIHPFLDGNGRVGRLLSVFMLKKSDFGFRGLVALEGYIDEHRQNYYDLLSSPSRDITPFIEFFLEAAVAEAEKSINQLKNIKEELPEDNLLPRRREIFAIIRDHKMVSFDALRRRFSKVSESTLHYDLRQLMKQGLVKKLGVTRGVVYVPVET